jgi:hypothetical protein
MYEKMNSSFRFGFFVIQWDSFLATYLPYSKQISTEKLKKGFLLNDKKAKAKTAEK